MGKALSRLDFHDYQNSQEEGLLVSAGKGRTKPKPKYDEKKAVRRKQTFRLHRDTITALRKRAKIDRKTYSELFRECLCIGMKAKGIEYED